MLVFTSAVPDAVKESEPLRLIVGLGLNIDHIAKATSHNHTLCNVTLSDKL